jgi:hypothetical protein
MSVLNFKPEVWSKVILAAEKKDLVFGGPGIVNDDYEGEISGPGTTVHITQFGDPEVSNYAPSESIAYQELDDAGQELLIDQRKYFAFTIDDVDKRQAAGDMQSYLEDRAAYKLADVADQFIAGLYVNCAYANILQNDGTSTLTAGSEIAPNTYGGSNTNPADFYLKVVLPLKVKLDEAYVPKKGRYLVVPPWAEALLEQTQSFVSVATPAQQEVFREGLIGRVSGFDVYTSNNSIEFDTTSGAATSGGAGGGWVIQAGHPMAMTFAEQIVQTEALRLQTTFADAVRGLHVYGGRLVRPDHIAVAGVIRPAGI